MAASTGVSYLFRATGSVLGISLSTSILQNSLRKELPRVITGKGSAEIIEAIRSEVGYIKTLPHHLRHAAVEAYAHSMHLVFIAITVAAFLSVSRFLLYTSGSQKLTHLLLQLLCILPIRQHALPGRLDRK